MDNNTTQQIAKQTEIDAGNLPQASSGGFGSLIHGKKRLIILAVLVLFVLSALAFYFFKGQNKYSQSRSLYAASEAQIAYESGDLDTAKKIIEDVLKNSEDDPSLNIAKVNLISIEGNSTGTEQESFQKSMPYIEKALANGGNENPNILSSVGYAYETAGEYEKALEYYTRATEINPKFAEIWFHKGHALEFLGRAEEAQSAYDKAYEINPMYPLLLLRRGSIFMASGNFEAAIAEFERLLQTNATNEIKAKALASLSRIKKSQLDIPGALELSKQAIELSPNDSRTVGIHGYNLAISGQRSEGIEHLKKAIELNPRISWNYDVIGEIYRANKQYSEAIQFQKGAISKAENDNTILDMKDRLEAKGFYTYNLAKTYAMSGLSVDIVPLLADAVSLSPKAKDFLILDNNRLEIYNNYENDSRFTALIQ